MPDFSERDHARFRDDITEISRRTLLQAAEMRRLEERIQMLSRRIAASLAAGSDGQNPGSVDGEADRLDGRG